jgi:hypothetical protein
MPFTSQLAVRLPSRRLTVRLPSDRLAVSPSDSHHATLTAVPDTLTIIMFPPWLSWMVS